MDKLQIESEREVQRIDEIQRILWVIYTRMAFPIYALFYLNDVLLRPGAWKTYLAIRAMIIPIGIFNLLWISRAQKSISAQASALFAVFSISLLTDIIILISPFQGHYSGLMLITMASSFFIPFTPLFWWMSIIGTYTPYYIGYFILHRDADAMRALVFYSFNFISAIGISYFVSRFHEALRLRELTSRLQLQAEVKSRDQIIKEKTEEAIALQLEVRENQIFSDVAKRVSHDIRSPMSALNMVIGAIRGIPQEQRSLLLEVSSRVNDIANDLLRMARSGSQRGGDSLTMSADLKTIVHAIQEIVAEIRAYSAGRSIEIVWTEPSMPQNFVISVEPPKLKRILANLINNAIEAMPDGGSIELRASDEGEQFVIEIADNGIGIPEEILPSLMSEGFSFGKENGNGLGLYMAKKDIEGWRGQLRISSQYEKGTTVQIYLQRVAGGE